MNTIALTGRMTAAAEMRTTATGTQVARFTVASRRDKDNTDFINCVAFDKTAQFVEKYFNKGDGIEIVGALQMARYEKDGTMHTSYSVRVNNVSFPVAKNEGGATAGGAAQGGASAQNNNDDEDDYSDLPF